MNKRSRREFLTDVGRGMVVASVGASLASDLGFSPAFAQQGSDRLTFGTLEPLVSLMQETPAARLQPILIELGGRRRVHPDSHNVAWRNASFRGYADYMETEPFRAGVDRLLEIARAGRTAIMCSVAVWWRCHRSMVADYLKAMGVQVFHILSTKKVQEHPYTSAAHLVDGR